MTKTRDLANLIADSKVGPSEIDTAGTYQVNSLGVGKAASVKLDVAGDIASSTKLHVTIGANTPVIRLTNTINSGGNIDMYSYSDGAFYINNAAGTGIGMLANKDVYVGKNFSVGDSALSTYHANYPAIDIGSSASVQGYTGNNGVWLQSNLFMNTNGHWTSKSDDYSAMIELYDGNINFYNTASGTGTRTLLTPMTIRQSGNVGINTSNPVAPLVISNGGASGIEFHPEIANNYNRMTNYNRSSNSYNQLGIDASQIDIRPSGVRRFSVTTAGAIVNPDARADADFRVVSDSNSYMLFVDSSANKVSIGSQSYNYGSALTVHANDSNGAPTSLFLRNSGTLGGAGATIQAGYTSGYGAQIRFNGNPSSYRMASTTFATVTGDGTTQDNVQISTTGDTIVYNDLGVGHSGNPDHVLDVQSSVSGSWVSQIYNTHNSNGYGLKVRAGDNGDVDSFRVAAQNNDVLLNVDGAGRVTKPKQPSFLYYSGGDVGFTAAASTWTDFRVFGLNQHNIGNHYNTSTDTFTCPVTGVYAFFVNVREETFYGNWGLIQVAIAINGTRQAVTAKYDGSQAEETLKIYITRQCSANDTVKVQVNSSSSDTNLSVEGSRTTYFGGHLLG